MRNLLAGTLLSAALLAIGAFAQSPYGPQPGGPQGGYGPRGQYRPDSVSALIDRVHADLNGSYEGGWAFTHRDRSRLNHAEKELRDFAKKWYRGRFDKGELDDSISSIQHVVDNNHMPPRDRTALDVDVNQLRTMREAYDRRELFVR
jgi:hypothetical protein